MRLIDAEALKEEFDNLLLWKSKDIELIKEVIDNAPAVIKCSMTSDGLPLMDLRPRSQGEWYEYIDKGLLKARHGDYVLYKVDYLLDNLAREVNIMESARKMKGGAE